MLSAVAVNGSLLLHSLQQHTRLQLLDALEGVCLLNHAGDFVIELAGSVPGHRQKK